METLEIGMPVSDLSVKYFYPYSIRLPIIETLAEFGFHLVPMTASMSKTERDEIWKKIDGVFGGGGPDLASSSYNEKPHEMNDPPDLAFTLFLIEMMGRALDEELPLRTACLSTQAVNVAKGGKLFQHIPDISGTVEHRAPALGPGVVVTNDNYPVVINGTEHVSELSSEHPLLRFLPTSIFNMNSAHHQSIKGEVHPSLKIVGRASDGIVESLTNAEGDGRYIGDQPHPEVARYSASPSLTLYRRYAYAFFATFRDFAEVYRRLKKTKTFALN